MRKLLIADGSEDSIYVLQETLKSEYEIRTCRDGNSALRLLDEFRPDAIVLNITLPYIDGFTVLEEAKYRPPIILAVVTYNSDYISKRSEELGIRFLMISPQMSALRARLNDLFQMSFGERRNNSGKIKGYLDMLNIPSHRDGYRQLMIGVPLFAKDPGQHLGKELYVTIAKYRSEWSTQHIESSIRRAINAGWNNGDKSVWNQLFPGTQECPSNKVFIARLAELFLKEK